MPDDTRVVASNGHVPSMSSPQPPQHTVLRNEFAIVGVSVVGGEGRRRLRIEDLRSEVSVELDALELESLAWARHLDLSSLLDPNLTRWQSGGENDA